MKTSSSKQASKYVTNRQRIARVLAAIYILSSQTPLMIGLAAPQVFFRPTGGISRLPLQVAAFNPPGFGDVEDAINLATGNVYVAMDGASKNNILQSGKDETTSNLNGNWNLNSRLRLGGFLRSHTTTGTTTTTPPPSLFLGTGDGAGTTFQKVTSMTGLWGNAPSWIRRYQSSTDLANTNFYTINKNPGDQYSSEWVVYRTRTGTVPTGALTNTFTFPNRVILPVNKNFNAGNSTVANPSTLASDLDFDGYLDGITANATSYGWLNTNLNLSTGDVVTPTFVGALPPGAAPMTINIEINDPTGATYPGTMTTCQLTSTPSNCTLPTWTKTGTAAAILTISGIQPGKTAYFGGFNSNKQFLIFLRINTISFGAQVNSNLNLNATGSNLSNATSYPATSASTTNQYTLPVATSLDPDGQLDGYYSASGGGAFTLPLNATNNARLNPSIVLAAPPNAADTSVSLSIEDQTGVAYPNTAKSCTVSSAPSTCEIGDWTKPADGKQAFLAIRSVQAEKTIYVGGQKSNTFTTNGTITGSGALAHYYDHAGTRYTFFNDGEYVDYQQNLYQQERAAKYNADPEGEKTACLPDAVTAAACTAKTEFTYATGNAGRITKAKDQWGRVTTYDWAVGGLLDGTLTNINYLLRNEADPTTAARRAAFTYSGTSETGAALPGQTVSKVVYTTGSGKKENTLTAGNTYATQNLQGSISRTFEFKYKLIGNTIAISRIIRPTEGQGSTGQAEIKLETVYGYYPSVAATDTVGVAKAGRLKTVQQFQGTTKTMADTTYDLVPGLSNTYGGITYTTTQGLTVATQKRTKYLFDDKSQLREKQVRDASNIYDVQTGGATTQQDRTLTWKYDYYNAITATQPGNTFTTPAVIDITTAFKNFNSGGATIASPATQPLTISGLDPDNTLNGFVSSATGSYLNTKLNAVAGKTITPSIVAQTTTGTALVYLGIQNLQGAGQVTEKACTVTTTPTRCTMDAYPVPSNSVDLQFAISIQAGKTVYLGGQNSGAFTVGSTPTAPIGSTKTVTDPAGKRLEYAYDTYGNVNNVQTFALNSATAEREEQWGYDTDNQLTSHTIKGRSGTRSGASYTYGDVVDSIGYVYHQAFTADNQSFRAPSEISTDITPVGKAGSKITFDEQGRLTTSQVQRNGTVRRTTTITYKAGEVYGTYLHIPYSDANGESDRAIPSKQFADWPATISTSNDGESRQFYYDAFGNRTVEIANGVLTTANAAGAIVTDRQVVIRSFNGFGQQVFNKVYSDQGTAKVSANSFAANGALKDTWDGNANNVTQYTYDTNGRVSTVVHGVGANGSVPAATSHGKMVYTYDADFGRVSSQVINGVLTKNFEYDTLDRTIRTSHLQSSDVGEAAVYEDSRYDVSGIKNYQCQSGGRANLNDSSTNTQKRCLILTVNSLGRITNTQDWTPNTSTTFDVSLDYDNFDRVIIQSNYGLIDSTNSLDGISTYFIYDDHGSLTKQLDPIMRGIPYAVKGLGGSTTISDTRRPMTQYRYTDYGLQYAKAVLLKGSVTASQLAGYDLVGTGVCPQSTDIYAATNLAVTCTNYDTLDRVSSTYDADGYKTTLYYDKLNNVTSQIRQVWKSTTDPGRSTATDAGFDSVTTQSAYDAVGRKVLSIDPRGTNSGVKYDTLGNPLAQMTDTLLRTPNTTTNVAIKITSKVYQYTSDGLLERVAEPLLSDGSNVSGWGLTFNGTTPPSGYGVTSLFEYGFANRAVPSKKCDAFKNVAPTLAGEKCATYTDYDSLNRVKTTKLTQPNGSIILQKYDTRSNVVSMTDADGFTTTYKYDPRGRVTSQTNLRRTGSIDMTAIPNDLTSTYVYDRAGNLSSKLERGLTTSYVYNTIGKVIAESRPSSGTTIDKMYAYRLDGEKVAETIYGTLASGFTNPDNFGGTNLQLPEAGTNGSGAILGYQLSPNGLKIRDYHTLPLSFGYLSIYQINGLGQWCVRDFTGVGKTYEEVFISGSSNSATADFSMSSNYKTYHKHNQNGQLLLSFDEYTYTSTSGTLKPQRNSFTYEYAPNGKQLSEKRNVQVVSAPAATWSAVPANFINKTYALASSENGAGLNYSNAWYNEREQLEKASIYDTSSNGAPAVQRDTTYSYFDDGSKSLVQVGGLLSQTKTFDYDSRGRQVSVSDANGKGDGVASTETVSYSNDGASTQTLTSAGTQPYSSTSRQTIAGLEALSNISSTNGSGGCTAANCGQSSTKVYDTNGRLITNTLLASETSKTDVTETATFLYDPIFGIPKTYKTGSITRNTVYNETGAIIEENVTTTSALSSFSDISQRPLTVAGASGFPNIQQGKTISAASYYIVDSRGFRLSNNITSTSGSPLSGRTKRYNADMQTSSFSNDISTSGYDKCVAGAFVGCAAIKVFEVDRLYFRYDPFGNQVLAIKANILEHGGFVGPTTGNFAATPSAITLQTYSTASVDGSTQALIYRSGKAGSHLNTYIGFGGFYWGYLEKGTFTASTTINENAVQDETYGLYEGVLNDTPGFDVTKPFAVTVPNTPGNAPLEAPTTALSTATKVDPTAIEAPGSTPSTDTPSSNIQAPKDEPKVQPASTPTFSSGANLNANTFSPTVSTPAFGVTSFTINPNVIPSSTTSNSPASTKAESIPAFTSQFSLEAPVSVLPPAISSFSVTSIVNPLENLGSIPNLGSVSDISAPGVTAPGTVSTPSSGAGGITAPSDSSAGIPELPRIESPNGNVSSVVSPISSSKGINTLGYYDLGWAGCQYFEDSFAKAVGASKCTNPKNLAEAQTRHEMDVARQTGNLNDAVAAGIGKDIRDDVMNDPALPPSAKKDLTTIDSNLEKLPARDRVEYRVQLEIDLKHCGDSAKCKADVLNRQAKSTSEAAGKPGKTAASYWGNNPRAAATPTQRADVIKHGLKTTLKWNKSHYKNGDPVFYSEGYQFGCNKTASQEKNTVLSDVHNFYSTHGRTTLYTLGIPNPTDLSITFVPDSSNGKVVNGTVVNIYTWTVPQMGPGGVQKNQSVTADAIDANTWRFRTNPGHPIYDNSPGAYPSGINFGLYDLGEGQVLFLLAGQGNLSSLENSVLYHNFGGNTIEDTLWGNLAADIANDCKNPGSATPFEPRGK